MRVGEVHPGPLFPDDGPRGARVWRRTRGIVAEIVLFVLVTVLFVPGVVVAFVVDLALWLRRRKPWMAVRLLAMAWWFLLGELRGIAGARGDLAPHRRPAGRGIAAPPALVSTALRSTGRAATSAASGSCSGCASRSRGWSWPGPGPLLVLIRHASIIDNTLPDAVIGRAHGIGLRFVLKRELQMIPTIDIGGRWVPTIFVRRGGGDTERRGRPPARARARPRARRGVLDLPGGHPLHAEKLARAQELIAERQPESRRSPPGCSTCCRRGSAARSRCSTRRAAPTSWSAATSASTASSTSRDIWRGGLVGTTVRVSFWRHPAAEVPAGREERIAWLYERWQTLDDWIGEQTAP